jgi:cytochrome c oxidase subunit 3
LLRRTPFHDSHARFLAGRFGLGLFLTSLAILFASTLVGFLVMRLQIGLAGQWPELPPLPRVLWLSTLVIVASSGTIQYALVSIRRDRQAGLSIGLMATLGLGTAFLVLQSIAWVQWIAPVAERWQDSNQWRFALTVFYIFTVLHAAHVVGGLIPMALVLARAIRANYVSARHAGVHMCAMYWHFLDAVWLVLFAVLVLGV